MRALSLRQALKCESAEQPRCKCRCHGTAHGRRRANDLFAEPLPADAGREFFEALPPEDPHHLPRKDP